MISTSPIKISCVIDGDRVPDAGAALHAAFELGDGGVRPSSPFGVSPGMSGGGGRGYASRSSGRPAPSAR